MEKSLAKRIALYACVGDEEVRRLRRKVDALEKGMIHAYHNSRNYDQLREMYCTPKALYWIYTEQCYYCSEVVIVHGDEEGSNPKIFECVLSMIADCDTTVCVDCVVHSNLVSCVKCKDMFCGMCHAIHLCIQE